MNEVDPHKLNKELQQDRSSDSIDFINVCTPKEYKDKCIPGIRNMPLDEIEKHVDEFKAMDTIYVHCMSGRRGELAIKKLQELGVDAKMYNLSGGLYAWEKAGLETVTTSTGLPIIRQVMLVAGSLVLIGGILSLLVDQHWVYLSLFVGAGLTFSGATGYCGMMYILSKMPWNK